MIKKNGGSKLMKTDKDNLKKKKKITNKEVIQTRRSLRSLHQLRQDPAGWYANAQIATCQETKIPLKHVSFLSPVESSHSLLFISRHQLWLLAIFSECKRGKILGARQAARRGVVLALQLTPKVLPIDADEQSTTEEWKGRRIAFG